MVDGWRLSKRWFWPERHQEILHSLLARAQRGTAVVYLPGNHDEALRRLIGQTLGGVRFLHDVVHRTADGRRLLVTHGDAFDGVCKDMRWLARLGSVAYDTALLINTGVNLLRRRLGLGYWPLSAFLKAQVKAAVNFVERYEHTLAAEARRRRVTGVVCGHVHKPEMRVIEGVRVLQRRRLGRELLGAGRAHGRPARAAALGRAARARPAPPAPAAHRAAGRARRRSPPDADPPGDRRLGPAGQRRGPHAAAACSRNARRWGTGSR